MKRVIFAFLVVLALLVVTTAQQGMGPGPGLGKPPGGGGASDFVTDSFTESGDTSMASHTPEVGGTITLHPAAVYVSTLTVHGANDDVFANGTTAYYYAATPPSADYYVQSDIHLVNTQTTNIGPCGHMDTTADTMVCVRANDGNVLWELRQIVAGAGSTLASSGTNFPTTGQTKSLRITFGSGGTTASVQVDGTTVIAATSISVTATGKAGVRASGAVTSTTGLHLDNFSAR